MDRRELLNLSSVEAAILFRSNASLAPASRQAVKLAWCQPLIDSGKLINRANLVAGGNALTNASVCGARKGTFTSTDRRGSSQEAILQAKENSFVRVRDFKTYAAGGVRRQAFLMKRPISGDAASWFRRATPSFVRSTLRNNPPTMMPTPDLFPARDLGVRFRVVRAVENVDLTIPVNSFHEEA